MGKAPRSLIKAIPPEQAETLGYENCRCLPDGRTIGLQAFIFTTGLVVDISEAGYSHRYCYARREDAEHALLQWDGTGHPGGPWIKRKGIPGECSNPSFKGVKITSES